MLQLSKLSVEASEASRIAHVIMNCSCVQHSQVMPCLLKLLMIVCVSPSRYELLVFGQSRSPEDLGNGSHCNTDPALFVRHGREMLQTAEARRMQTTVSSLRGPCVGVNEGSRSQHVS